MTIHVSRLDSIGLSVFAQACSKLLLHGKAIDIIYRAEQKPRDFIHRGKCSRAVRSLADCEIVPHDLDRL